MIRPFPLWGDRKPSGLRSGRNDMPRKAKKGLAICSDGIYLKADSKRVHLSWYDFLLMQISTTDGGFKLSEYWFVNWSGGSELMAEMLSDIQRRIIDDIYFK